MSEQKMVVKALAALFRSHGEPREEEVNFVAHAALELALSPEDNAEVQEVLKQGGSYESFLKEITSKNLRTYLFRRVVAASLIDEQIEDHELAVIRQTAQAFDFKEDVVKDYIAWMKEGIAWEKRGTELIAKIQ